MNAQPTPHHTLVGAILLLAAFGSAALTLGRQRGAALIGQPLELTIQARPEAGDDRSALCFDAEVFYGDTRIGANQVTTRVESNAASQEVTVRLRAAVAIDEPVVTVYLRAGCTQKVTRKYVVLADVPSEPATSAAPGAAIAVAPSGLADTVGSGARPAASQRAAVGATPRRGERAPRAAPGTAGNGPAAAAGLDGAAGSSLSAAAPGSPNAAPANAAPAQRPASVVRRRQPEPAPARPRLQLEPLDLLAERDPTLRLSTAMLAQPEENPRRRAEAAALWRALNAQPLDILRDAQRVQTLEGDVKGLREQSAKTQASLAELRGQLQKAQAERYSNVLVYGLALVLLAALAVAGWLWQRGRRDAGVPQWWRQLDAGASDAPDSLMPAPASRPAARATSPNATGPIPIASSEVDLGVDESMFNRLAAAHPSPPPARAAAASDFQASMPGSTRAVNAEELFDIQQQADFFVSLGQYEQAIEVLQNHISDNVETSALAYLDLLKIYHKLDRRGDFDLLRQDFNQVFNAEVPVFEAFGAQSSGLEAYGKALSRIEALWPSPKVLEIIEESIFRKPGAVDGEAFDLEAYRELLLLYAIAKDVVDRGAAMDFDLSTNSQPPSGAGEDDRPRFSSTNIQPLSALLPAESSPSRPPRPYLLDAPELQSGSGLLDALPEIAMPRPSPRLGLDIDLTEPAPASAFMDVELPLDLEPLAFDTAPPELPADTAGDVDALAAIDIDSSGESVNPQEAMLSDFDLFDAAVEREIAPGKLPKKLP